VAGSCRINSGERAIEPRAKDIFAKASDLSPQERPAFLDQSCAGDGAVRAQVESLLTALDAASAATFLATPTAADNLPTLDHDPRSTSASSQDETIRRERADAAAVRESPGTRIGPYKLLQELGEGGFGTVFMAEQEKPVQRRVALKIIKLGMDTRQVVARFEQERQALAMMDHPNIAKVLDAGATEAGRPYFVMELVKGDPITAYCDKGSLPIPDRLELFAQVCQAVQHAHQKGVIHRDIKPSNILVSTQDGRPYAKVIDFGIAKATASKMTEKTLFTQHHQIIGTPEYMSPEQAEGSLDIDTRTDVYSLGVLLYELLTGTTPFGGEELRSAAYQEIQRIIREVEPPAPSTRLSRNTATLGAVAARRGIEPRRLGSLVRGELDWIVMRALEKDRQRRYESANSLAADVRRYLEGRAVEAAPPGAAYRLRKFVRRHKGPVGASAAVAAALLLGIAGFAWQAHRVAEQRDAAIEARRAEERERDKANEAAAAESVQRALAETNAKTAQAINDFLLNMLGAADIRKAGRNATVAQAMQRAAENAGESFKDSPEVEGAVRLILGKTYASLGMLDEAQEQLDRAREILTSQNREASEPMVHVLTSLAHVRAQRGDDAGDAGLGLRAAELASNILGPENPATLAAWGDYANTLVRLGRREDAEPIMRQTLAIRERIAGPGSRDTQILLNSLGVLLHGMNRLDEAEKCYRDAMERGVRYLGPDDPDTLIVRMNLGSLLRSRGKLAEAEPVMLEAYAGMRRVYGDSHTKTALAATVVARLLDNQGRRNEAMPYFEEAAAIYERAQGKNTPGVAESKRELANMLSETGGRDRAVPIIDESVAAFATLGGKESADYLSARRDQANILVRAGEHARAESIFRELLEVCPRVLGEAHETTVIVLNSYAVLLMNQDRFADAEPYIRRSFEIGKSAQGPEDRTTLTTQMNLTVVLREAGRLEEAESLGRDLIERAERAFGPVHSYLGRFKAQYAETLVELGRADEAKTQYVQAIAIIKAALGDRQTVHALAGVKLARLLIDTGDAAAAEQVISDAVAVYAGVHGDRDRRVAWARLQLGRCLTHLGRFDEAERVLNDSHAVLTDARAPGHADLVEASQGLADLYAAWNAAQPDPARAARADEWRLRATPAHAPGHE